TATIAPEVDDEGNIQWNESTETEISSTRQEVKDVSLGMDGEATAYIPVNDDVKTNVFGDDGRTSGGDSKMNNMIGNLKSYVSKNGINSNLFDAGRTTAGLNDAATKGGIVAGLIQHLFGKKSPKVIGYLGSAVLGVGIGAEVNKYLYDEGTVTYMWSYNDSKK